MVLISMCSSNNKPKTSDTLLLFPKRNINSLYKNVKSRYLEKLHNRSKHHNIARNKTVKLPLQLELASEKIYTVQEQLTLDDMYFIERLKNDDNSSIINFILNMDNVRQSKKNEYRCGPSITSEPDLLIAIHNLLKVSESPIDMLHAVFTVSRYKTTDTEEEMEHPSEKWMWVAETIMNMVLMSNNHTDDGGDDDDRSESAVCWYAAGIFYGRNGHINEAMEYLEKARAIANSPNRLKFPSLPASLHLKMGVEPFEKFVEEPYSVWTMACLYQTDLLRKIAIRQEPDKALQTLQYAHELLRSSGEPGSIPRILNAEIQYDLGLKYKAVGLLELSVNAFRECARAAENSQNELDLEAKIIAAQMDPNPPKTWSLMELKEEAKKKLNFRLLIKTIVSQGMVAKKKEMFEECFYNTALAFHLSRNKLQNADALDIEIALFDMAICRTERHIRMYSIFKKFDSFQVNEFNQWTDPEEKHMYYKAQQEARNLCKLFEDIHYESGDDEQFLENNEQFSDNDEELSVNEEEFLDVVARLVSFQFPVKGEPLHH